MNNLCKSILAIDDDPAILQTIRDVLELQGYEVHTAQDGAAGIEKLNSLRVPPCVILLDLMMPGVNGWGFLDFQRAHPVFSLVPVIICSAYENSAKSIGMEPILVKPVKLESLLNAVKSFCA